MIPANICASLLGNRKVSGQITANIVDSSANVDLTALGGSDYHIYNAASALNVGHRKSGGGSTINVFLYDPLPNGYAQDSQDQARTYTASDATPTASVSSVNHARIVKFSGNLPEGGVRMTVPAGTALKSAKFYVMGYTQGATANQMSAVISLSDNSVAPVTINKTIATNAGTYHVINVDFKASSAGQTLTVIWKFNAVATDTLRAVFYGATWVS